MNKEFPVKRYNSLDAKLLCRTQKSFEYYCSVASKVDQKVATFSKLFKTGPKLGLEPVLHRFLPIFKSSQNYQVAKPTFLLQFYIKSSQIHYKFPNLVTLNTR